MLNILYALLAGAGVTLALYGLHWLTLAEAIVPGVLVAVVTVVLLARRAYQALEAIMMDGARLLQVQPPRFAQAIAKMAEGYPLARRQIGIRSQIDAQIGIVYFLQQEFARALPYLQRSYLFGHWMAGAMLGVVQYKRHDVPGMRRTFAAVLKKSKKQGLPACLYAHLLLQVGERDEAQRVLADAASVPGADPRVNEAYLAVQNGKKIRMRAFREQWYQFHLERPPVSYQTAPGGGHPGRAARRSLRG